MLAVEMDRDEAEELALDSGGKIFLAAVNGAKSMTLSGDADALEAVAVDLQQRKAFNRFLQVQYAFHSAQMDPVCEPLLAALRDIKPHKVRIPLYSTVTGEAVDGPELTGEYWWRNVRQAVLFADAMDRLIDSGHTAAVELSPHPVLGNSITDCFRARGKKVKVFTSLRRKEDERPTMLRALGGLHAAGRAVDWSRVVPSGREWVRMPTYAWQHERFWQETDGSRNERVGHLGHRLLGAACHTPQPAWESKVDCRILPYMADHRVQGAALIPATGYLETALAAAIQTTGPGTYFLEDVRLLKACFLPQGQTRVLRTTLDPDQSTFEITSRKEGGEKSWTTHVRGTIRQRQDKPPISKTAIDELKARCPREMGGADCYAMFKQIGLDYGPTFQGIERIWQGQSEALSRVSAPELIAAQLTDYHCHPALFDACWQSTIGVFVTREDSRGAIILPVEVEQVRVYGPLGPDLWSHARLVEKNRQGVVVDVHVYDDAGQLLVDVRGLQCQIIGGGGTSESLDELLYEYQWLFQPRAVTASTGPREMEFLGSLEPVRASGIAYAEQVMQEVGMLDRFAELEPGINRLCSLYIQLAFRNLGGQFDLGRRFTTEEAVQRLGIVPQHHRIFARYVGMLADDGLLRRDGDGWIVIDELAREDPQPLWNRLLASNPSSFAELTLVRRCALQLHEVLRGTVNPLHLIFPDGSLAIAEHLYQDSPTVRFYNQLAQRAIHQALENLPAGRTVRVLEIGAGTGGLTSFVLPMLPEGRTEYTFTDLSNHFFVKAEQKFADYPFIKYQKLDIERSPLEQGFVANSFDLVLASQVLHATAELKQTVTGIREVMSSRGLLVLLEAVKPARWVDMVFGLTEGWWRFVDRDRRPEYPLMTVAGWQKLLGEIGFTDTVDIAGVKANEALGSAVILSRGPSLALCGVPAALHGTGSACGNNHDVACCHDQPRSAVAATDEDAAPGSWIILADQGGAAEKLAAILRSRGAHCSLVFSGDKFEHDGDRFKVAANSADDMRNMLSIALGSDLPACRGIVDLWNLDLTDIDRTLPDDVVATQDRGAFHVVSLIQAWNDLAGDRTIPLWLVTCQAQSVNAARDGILPLQTPVWGLGRVIMNEYPRLRARLVDLGDGSTRELLALADEVWTPDDEDEIAIRGDARYVHRFASTSIDKQGVAADKRLLGRNSSAANAADGTANAERAYRLQVSSAGLLDGLTLRAFERTEPATGQVEILVRAAALNFSDVMKALGLYPGLPDGPVAVGIECAGVVSAVGPDVTEFKVGDEVLAIAPFSFASHVITSTLLVAPKPSHITFEEAATIPIAFLTAAYALDYLGRLEPGERVLIHAASGGVGLAAIQLARRTGAEIFATAGSPDKRQFLNALGIEHVMDSRSLAFADEVMETTNGRGVDVVLNSLSGEAIPKGLQCLADYGRFLEIGKRDIYGNSRIGLKPFRKNLSFMAIDLDRAMREKPHVLANLFRQVVRDVAEKKLYALPHRVFSITNVVAAFRYMSQAKHIGKVVMTMHDRVVPAPDSRNSLTFRPDATYLLSGGLGGFGLTVAKWLVDQGARHLVLMGRRGIHSPEVERQVEDLRRAGATVVVAKADVSRSQDVAGVLADIARDMPPLRGVFHAAMFLEDSLLVKLDHDRWSKIMLPKVNGAWHLHTQTLGMSLDYFVMFSSMTSVFGLAGQASYAASNTFLDSLAYYRQARGLPGLSISWGYLAEVGWVARNEAVAERLEGQGVKSYSPRQALALLGGLMQYRSIHVCVGNVDWANMRSLETAGNISKRFAGLRKQLDKNQDGPKQDGASIRKAILAAKPDQQLEMMAGVIRDKVARVLGTNVDRVVVDKPLTELGLDSLMAVELRNWIEGELRVNLPIVELMQGPTINRVAEILLAQMSPDAAPKAEPPAEKKGPPAAPVPAAVTADRAADANGNGHGLDGERAAELLENIDDLSDDEVNALLRSLQSEKE
jgi:acyl transferase domain-containing protein/SAM-dependent methyltransferase/acyl carrier protein